MDKSHEGINALDRMLQARLRGLDGPAPILRNVERRQSSQYIADLSYRLSGAELEVLAQATVLRESGLQHARRGDLEKALTSLAEAQTYVEKWVKSEEGMLSASSFQAAAEAYVYYRQGSADAAESLLTQALCYCKRLMQEYGHSLEVRRVHLARNVARSRWIRATHSEGWDICVGLLNYLWSSFPWPLDSNTDVGTSMRNVIRSDERWFLTDQVLSETISLILDAKKNITQWSPVNSFIGNPEDDDCVERAHHVLELCRTMLIANDALIMEGLATHFKKGPGVLPMVYSKLDSYAETLEKEFYKEHKIHRSK